MHDTYEYHQSLPRAPELEDTCCRVETRLIGKGQQNIETGPGHCHTFGPGEHPGLRDQHDRHLDEDKKLSATNSRISLSLRVL